MRINLTSVFVDDQTTAKTFYTEVLRFRIRHEIPLGDDWWLTVVAPEDPDGTELLLEPSGHPAVTPYRRALYADAIPQAQFEVDDVEAEYQRLSDLGVEFRSPPAAAGEVTMAVFDDTCGNWIAIVGPPADADS